MDYEKKYKEALERMRYVVIEPKNENMLQAIKETVFPELKESKEEKTERILHSISSKMSLHLRDIFTEEEFQCFDTWSNVWLEKQVGQKLPIEKLPSEMKTIGESLGFTTQEECDEYNQMVSDLIMSDDDKGEQKPAWSEEDTIKINNLIILVKNEGSIKTDLRDEYEDWLKSLKQRIKEE